MSANKKADAEIQDLKGGLPLYLRRSSASPETPIFFPRLCLRAAAEPRWLDPANSKAQLLRKQTGKARKYRVFIDLERTNAR